MRWSTLALIALIGYGGYHWYETRPVHTAPGMLVADGPSQTIIESSPHLQLAGYRVEPLAQFALTARVLGAEHYHLDRESGIAPVDLALGWGRMSDATVLSKISITQSGRFYFWHVAEFPIPREEIESHSANMHMIPANAGIARRLQDIRPGQIVHLRGYLVAIDAHDGWHWRSSLSRTDTGNGACELVWVESLEIVI